MIGLLRIRANAITIKKGGNFYAKTQKTIERPARKISMTDGYAEEQKPSEEAAGPGETPDPGSAEESSANAVEAEAPNPEEEQPEQKTEE